MASEKRLIDANALMDSHWWESLTDDFDRARAKIIVMSAPTVDAVEVVHAKWEFTEDGYQCSKCQADSLCDGWNHPVRSNFCPCCGAKMGKNENPQI